MSVANRSTAGIIAMLSFAVFFVAWRIAQGQSAASPHTSVQGTGESHATVIDLYPQESVGNVVKYHVVYDYDRKTASLIRIESDAQLHVKNMVVEKVLDYTHPVPQR